MFLVHVKQQNVTEQPSQQDNGLVRDYGLEFVAVFHTLAVNMLLAECVKRLGAQGNAIANSLYDVWQKSVNDSINSQMNIARSKCLPPVLDKMKDNLNQAKAKVDQDIRRVLGLTQ